MRKKKSRSFWARLLRQIIDQWKKLVPIVLGFLGIVGGILAFYDDIDDIREFLVRLRFPGLKSCYFNGNVIDEQGKPLPGVLLNVSGGLGTDSTDALGNFKFKVKALRGEQIRLTCTKPGYQIYDNYFVLPGPATILLKKEKKK